MEKHRSLRITFQAIILCSVLLYGFIILSDIPTPNSNWINTDFIKSLIFLIVSYAILIYILVRMCFKNVKKWEIILYNIINVICVIIIFVYLFEITSAIQDMFQNHNPFDHKNQWDEYINYDEEYEYIAMPAGFGLFIFGIPNTILAFVFAVITMVVSFRTVIVKRVDNNQEEPKQANDMLDINLNTSQEMKINNEDMYCKYCGKQFDVDGKFCKYCGKEIK